ncbi:MAG: biopolymer transporter ExbD, partial [Planctomycetes bacterium]|nr:biopolymer transporter ExbD [Planctomycetota bacterium]
RYVFLGGTKVTAAGIKMLKASLPKCKISTGNDNSIVVEVGAKGNIRIEGQVLKLRSNLATEIRKQAKADGKSEILIKLHYLTRHEVTIMVIDAAKEAGIKKIPFGNGIGFNTGMMGTMSAGTF